MLSVLQGRFPKVGMYTKNVRELLMLIHFYTSAKLWKINCFSRQLLVQNGEVLRSFFMVNLNVLG